MIRGLFVLTGKPWIFDEVYREYAEVFREYLRICMKGVNYLKGKKLLLDDMGIAYDEYLRSSRRLTGLELELIRDRVTPNEAKVVVNEVHDSFQSWLNKARAYYKFRPVIEDNSLQGTIFILGELELIGRDNIGFDKVMAARTRAEGLCCGVMMIINSYCGTLRKTLNQLMWVQSLIRKRSIWKCLERSMTE